MWKFLFWIRGRGRGWSHDTPPGQLILILHLHVVVDDEYGVIGREVGGAASLVAEGHLRLHSNWLLRRLGFQRFPTKNDEINESARIQN